MELYKILVVDDEDEVRRGVIECVEWEKHGFTVVAEAANGVDALELAESLSPDLVITDIKMPYITGLELTHRLSLSLPHTGVIIITGFDDFELAQEAIRLNVIEYITKPINLAEITDVLERVHEKMDEERRKLRNFEFLRAHYEKSLPVLKESFILSLIEGRASERQVREQSALYGMSLDKKLFATACIKSDARTDIENLPVIRVSLKNMTEEICAKYMTAYLAMYMDYIIVLFCFSSLDRINDVIVSMNELCARAERQFDISISVGVGYAASSAAELKRSYRGALAALDYRSILDNSKIIFIEDLEPNRSIELRFGEKDELALLAAIRQNDAAAIRALIAKFLGIASDSVLPYQKYQTYLLDILNAISALAASYGIKDEIFGQHFNPLETIQNFNSRQQTQLWFDDICSQTAERIHRERRSTSARLVDDAKQYATENYGQPNLSAEEMCRRFHLSPAYFSSLFKKETGVTFVNYLTELRLNEAKRLLLESDLKTYLIAQRVGFDDANYFSFVFKKHFGVSPTKFRSGILE